jgi:hypothetical protein
VIGGRAVGIDGDALLTRTRDSGRWSEREARARDLQNRIGPATPRPEIEIFRFPGLARDFDLLVIFPVPDVTRQ